jgi:hypothetical protein
MRRSLTMTALLIAAATSFTCSPTAEGPLDPDADSKLAAACPALAHSCPSGCQPAGARPMDRQTSCLLPFQAWGCEPAGLIGPPSIGCSVTRDGTIWVSTDSHVHPLGRFCTPEEYSAIRFSSCS